MGKADKNVRTTPIEKAVKRAYKESFHPSPRRKWKARQHPRRHKVTCMECGRTAVITVPKCGYRCTCDGGTGEWHWFGKMNVASPVTSKYVYRWDTKQKFVRARYALERIKNPRYDPKAKKKYVEMWECHECFSRHARIPVEPRRVVKPPPRSCKTCGRQHVCSIERADRRSDFCYHVRGSWCRCRECTGPYYILTHEQGKALNEEVASLRRRVKELEDELESYESTGEYALARGRARGV